MWGSCTSLRQHHRLGTLGSVLVVWGLLFLVCMGLGWPTLKFYDVRLTSSDAAVYYDMVTGVPVTAEPHRFRVLVPYLARPFYWLAEHRIGTLEPVFFGLLVVNSLFTATTACLLIGIGWRLTCNYLLALLAATLYLQSFIVPNHQLAGLVDSSEAFMLMVLTGALLTKRWWLLPVLGVVGGLAKETFVPLAVVFASTWWLVVARHDRSRWLRACWVVGMGLAGLATVSLFQSLATGILVTPWDIATWERTKVDPFTGLVQSLTSHSLWYTFAWLLPLGVWSLARLPRPWVIAVAAAALAVLIMGATSDAGEAISRPLFSVAGPLLSLSTALTLAQLRPGAAPGTARLSPPAPAATVKDDTSRRERSHPA